MRSAEEYEANKHLFDRIVWVEQPGGPVDHTMKIEFDAGCMTKLHNNGTKLQLAKQVKVMVCHWAGMSTTAYDDKYGGMYDRFITNAVSVTPIAKKVFVDGITTEDKVIVALRQAGFDIAIRNFGEHVIATNEGARFDYWPSTGRVNKRTLEGTVNMSKQALLEQL